jgi:serine/threonine protein phosphatase 1
MLLNFFSPYMQGKKLEDLYDNPELIFLVNGGVWVEHYYQPEQQAMTAEFNDCLQLVLDMPAIWIVGEGLSRFHVIHAELLKTNLFIGRQSVWLDRDLDNWLTAGKIAHNILERLYWGRTLMRRDTEKQQPASMQKGLSTTFCGHTYATSPRQFLSHLCLDTGAFLSLESGFIEAENYGLTLFDVEQALWFQASYARADIRTGKMMLRE